MGARSHRVRTAQRTVRRGSASRPTGWPRSTTYPRIHSGQQKPAVVRPVHPCDSNTQDEGANPAAAARHHHLAMFRKAVIGTGNDSGASDPNAHATAQALLGYVAQRRAAPEQEIVGTCSPAYQPQWAALVRSYNGAQASFEDGEDAPTENVAGLRELEGLLSDIAGQPLGAHREVTPVRPLKANRLKRFTAVTGPVKVRGGRPVVTRATDFHFYVVSPFVGGEVAAGSRLMIQGSLPQLGHEGGAQDNGAPLVELKPIVANGDPEDRILEAKVRLDEPPDGSYIHIVYRGSQPVLVLV